VTKNVLVFVYLWTVSYFVLIRNCYILYFNLVCLWFIVSQYVAAL